MMRVDWSEYRRLHANRSNLILHIVAAPRPFTSRANFLRRWFIEQFIIFPWFVLSGRWWQQLRASGNMTSDES